MTYYDILEVSREASSEVIKNAYKALIKKYHPDNFENVADKQIAEEKIKKICGAYEILVNEEKKRAYDTELFTSGTNSESTDSNTPKESKKFERPGFNRQLLRWVVGLLILSIIGSGIYIFHQYQQEQFVALAQRKAEEALSEELALYLQKEALYLTLTAANNIDFQILPYEESKRYTDQVAQRMVFVNGKKTAIERGRTIQIQRQGNISDISRVASSMRDNELKEVTLKFKDMLLDDYGKNKSSYDRKLQSSNSLIDFLNGKIQLGNQFSNISVQIWLNDLSSKEIILDNPNYGVARQAIIGVLEKELGKDNSNSLFEEAKEQAKEQVSEDFQKRLPDVYNHFKQIL